MNNPTDFNRELSSGGGLQTSRLLPDEGSMNPLGGTHLLSKAGYFQHITARRDFYLNIVRNNGRGCEASFFVAAVGSLKPGHNARRIADVFLSILPSSVYSILSDFEKRKTDVDFLKNLNILRSIRNVPEHINIVLIN